MAKRETVTIKGPSDLVFPASVMGKSDIEARTVGMLSNVLMTMSPSQAYLAMKQVEHAVGFALKELKVPTMDEIKALGAKRMEMNGHKLELKGTGSSWSFGAVVLEMQAEHQKTIDALNAKLKALKEKEKAEGRATETKGDETLAVTLRP